MTPSSEDLAPCASNDLDELWTYDGRLSAALVPLWTRRYESAGLLVGHCAGKRAVWQPARWSSTIPTACISA